MVVKILDASAKLIPLMTVAITREVTTTQDNSTLFRGNSASTKLMTACTRILGEEYQDRTIKDLIIRLLQEDPMLYEVDPVKVRSGESVEDNMARLIDLCQTFLDVIINGMALVPLPFRIMAKHLQHEVVKRFPESKYTCVGGFIFLRFFCPTIMSPDVFGLVDAKVSKEQRRPLTLICKALQNLSNNIKFGKKEAYMEPMNDFIERNLQKTNDFFEEFVNINPDSVDWQPLASKEAILKSELRDLHAFCTENIEKICRYVGQNAPKELCLEVIRMLADLGSSYEYEKENPHLVNEYNKRMSLAVHGNVGGGGSGSSSSAQVISPRRMTASAMTPTSSSPSRSSVLISPRGGSIGGGGGGGGSVAPPHQMHLSPGVPHAAVIHNTGGFGVTQPRPSNSTVRTGGSAIGERGAATLPHPAARAAFRKSGSLSTPTLNNPSSGGGQRLTAQLSSSPSSPSSPSTIPLKPVVRTPSSGPTGGPHIPPKPRVVRNASSTYLPPNGLVMSLDRERQVHPVRTSPRPAPTNREHANTTATPPMHKPPPTAPRRCNSSIHGMTPAQATSQLNQPLPPQPQAPPRPVRAGGGGPGPISPPLNSQSRFGPKLSATSPVAAG